MMDETLKKAIASHLTEVLLSMLDHRDMCGTDLVDNIMKELESSHYDPHYPSDSTLYSALKRLMDQKLISQLPDMKQPKGAPKKLYRITEIGKQQLEQKRLEWEKLGELLGWFN
jgi:DNA-binding PadR family transcriptional regulator